MKRPILGLGISSVLCLTAMWACSEDTAGKDKATVDTKAAAFKRQPAPKHDGIYSFAHGCYALEAYDGRTTVKLLAANQAGDRFAFTADDAAKAAKLHLRASDLGTYLLYDADKRYFAAEKQTDGAFAFTRPATLKARIDLLDPDFVSPAEWVLQVSTTDSERFVFKHLASGRFLALDGLATDEKSAAIITLHPAQGCATFPELTIDAKGTTKPKKWDDGDVYGIAEIHSHITSDSGFGGGGLFHGAPFHRLGVERALPDCSRSHGKDGKRDLLGFFYDNDTTFDIAALLPVATSGEFKEFNHHTAGYPKFTDWPNSWRKSTHQTMYYRWIERAWLGGLRLIVQHATGNSVMCDLTVGTKAQKTLYSCNDMVSVDHAIEKMWAMERYIDAQSGGPGKGWLRIVKTPEEARKVINEGKLAMVLGIEISNLFDCFLTPPKGTEPCTEKTVRDKLDHYEKRGVRVIFPVHKYDNGFSAGDGQGGMIELGNFINSGHYSSFVKGCPGPKSAFDGGDVTFGGLNKPRDDYDSKAPHDFSNFTKDLIGTLAPFAGDVGQPALKGDYCQKHGLTPLGTMLINELMARGMMIDIAHLPQRALGETYKLLEKHDYPPLKTHGNGNGGRVYKLGGLLGTRLGRCSDPKKAGAMGKSLTNAVNEAKKNGTYAAEALSFDLNGLAGGPRPRFGKDSHCAKGQKNPVSYPFTSFDGNVTFQEPHLGDKKVDFNNAGMTHIGLLPEYIEDARRDGVTDKQLEPLFRSAEAFVRMWEKARKQGAAIKK